MRTKPYCEKLTITPKMAEEFLKRNLLNRPCADALVREYAEDMANGAFGTTNSIVFGEDGTLYDGQTRLRAIVRSGIPMRLTVEYNAPPKDRPTLDIGRKRTSGHWLRMLDIPDAPAISAALRYVKKWEEGCLGWNGNAKMTPLECEELLQKHPDILKFGRCRVTFAPGSLITGLAYIFSHKDHALACAFHEGMCYGFDPKKHPTFQKLREMLISASASSRQKIQPNYICAYTVIAWNSERAGKARAVFRWSPEVSGFPEIL